jgi:hypothetical protein
VVQVGIRILPARLRNRWRFLKVALANPEYNVNEIGLGAGSAFYPGGKVRRPKSKYVVWRGRRDIDCSTYLCVGIYLSNRCPNARPTNAPPLPPVPWRPIRDSFRM